MADYPNKYNEKTVAPKRLKEDQRLAKTSKSAKSELVQLKSNIETSVTKSSSGGFRPSRYSKRYAERRRVESTPTEAKNGVPLPLVEVGVSRLDQISVITEDTPLAEERLQKFLSRAGIASRRHAEQMILDGKVMVNGIKVLKMGTKVKASDRIEVDGNPILQHEAFYYYLLNKPTGVITSTSDPEGRRTVLDIMQGLPVRVYPVGRLDYDTSGLLLLTNDGELAHRLMHPSFGISKTYRLWLKGPVHSKTLAILRQGVLLDDGITAPAEVKEIKIPKASDVEVLEITIHEGRNRQIRRMCEAVGFPLFKLERIRFGPLKDTNLRSGQFRTLTQREIQELHTEVGLVRSAKREARGSKATQGPNVQREVRGSKPKNISGNEVEVSNRSKKSEIGSDARGHTRF